MRKPVLLLGAAGVIAAVLFLLLSDGEVEDDLVTETVDREVAAEAERATPDVGPLDTSPSRETVATADAAAASIEGPPESYTKALGGVIGRLVEPDGTPVPDMLVEALAATLSDFLPELGAVFDEEPPTFKEVKGTTRTDEEGRFRFEQLETRGIYVLGIDLGGPRAAVRFVDQAPNPGQVVDLGDIALDPYVTFTGRVIDEKGGPLANARVRATNLPSIIFSFGVQDVQPGFAVAFQEDLKSDWRVAPIPPAVSRLVDRFPVPQTRTEEDGTFRLEGVPLGMATVLVDKKNLVTLVHGPVPTGNAGERHLGDLKLLQGETLAGQVVDADDEPVANAEIMAGAKIEMAPAALLMPIARTDANGNFRASGLRDVDHVVAARPEGAVAWTLVKEIVPGYDEPVIRIGNTFKMTVIARNEAGEIVPRPKLAVQPANDMPIHPLLVPPISLARRLEYTEEGTAVVKELDPGKYSVLAKAKGYAVGQGSGDLREGSNQVEVVLEEELGIGVQVYEEASGQPVHYAMVSAFDPEAKDEALQKVPIVTSRTKPDGTAWLAGLKPGRYKLAVIHPGFATTGTETEVPGDQVQVGLKLGGILRGRIRAGNEPPDDSRFIALGPKKEERFPRFTVTDEAGEFEVTHLEAGEYNVTIMRRFADQSMGSLFSGGVEQYMPERFMDATIKEGEVTFLDIDILGIEGDGPTATLRGRIELNHAPGADLSVSARPEGGWRNRKGTRTDENGVFDFGEVPAGKVTVEVKQKGEAGNFMFGRMAEQKVELEANEVRELVFDLRTGRLRGTVIDDRTRAPVLGAEVSIRPDGKQPDNPFSGTRMQTASGRDGSFVFPSVPEGTFRVRVSRDDYADTSVGEIKVPYNGEPPPVVVRMSKGVEVTGLVELPEGTETPRWLWIEFRSEDEEGGRSGGRVDQETLAFKVDGLRPGTYQVQVRSREQYEPVRVLVRDGGMEGLVVRAVPKPTQPKTLEIPPR